jgi:g-D-glutamyl-meso-diaminopimelate peptidase
LRFSKIALILAIIALPVIAIAAIQLSSAAAEKNKDASLDVSPSPEIIITPEPEISREPVPEPTDEPEETTETTTAPSSEPPSEGGSEASEESEPEVVVTPIPEVKSKAVIPESVIVDTTTQLYTYDKMVQDLQEMMQTYPDYIKVSILDVTADGRNIYVARVGNPNAEREVLVHASMHAREYINSMLVMSQLEFYFQNWNKEYKDGYTYGDVFNTVCLYMIPMVNPDGVSISQFGSKGIRNDGLREKFLTMEGSGNYTRWKANVNGVNLNRNFNSFWAPDKDHPAFEGYCGEYAESEIETRAIVNLVNAHNFSCSIAYHTAEQTVYWNVGEKGQVYVEAERLAKLVSELTGYDMPYEESIPRGLDYNWLNLVKGIPAITIEAGISYSPLPLSEFPAMWKENKYVPVAACYLYCQGIEKGGAEPPVPEATDLPQETPEVSAEPEEAPAAEETTDPAETPSPDDTSETAPPEESAQPTNDGADGSGA